MGGLEPSQGIRLVYTQEGVNLLSFYSFIIFIQNITIRYTLPIGEQSYNKPYKVMSYYCYGVSKLNDKLLINSFSLFNS